jgi:hypothetical protein
VNGYRHVAAVQSLFEPGRLFANEADARAFDRAYATRSLGAGSERHFYN